MRIDRLLPSLLPKKRTITWNWKSNKPFNPSKLSKHLLGHFSITETEMKLALLAVINFHSRCRESTTNIRKTWKLKLSKSFQRWLENINMYALTLYRYFTHSMMHNSKQNYYVGVFILTLWETKCFPRS